MATGLTRRRWLGGHCGDRRRDAGRPGRRRPRAGRRATSSVTGDPARSRELALPGPRLRRARPRPRRPSPCCWPRCSPRLAVLAWLPLVLSVVVMLFAEVFRLPQWVQDLSPFEHLALVPAEAFALGAGRWRLLAVAAALGCHGTGRRSSSRPPLNRAPLCQDDDMWQPEPGWLLVPGGTGTSTWGCGARSATTGRSSSSGSRRPSEHDPPELSDPRHFAYWRRAADVSCPARSTRRRACARRSSRRSRRTTRGSPWCRTGSRTPPTAGCSPRTRWAGSPAPTSATGLAGRGPAARPAGPGRAPRRLADPGPDHGRRRRRPPVAAPRACCSTPLDALPQVAAARRPGAGEPARPEGDDVVAIDWGTLGHGPVGADLGYYALSAPRGVRAAARRLPARAARRPGRRARRSRSGPGSPPSTPR